MLFNDYRIQVLRATTGVVVKVILTCARVVLGVVVARVIENAKTVNVALIVQIWHEQNYCPATYTSPTVLFKL